MLFSGTVEPSTPSARESSLNGDTYLSHLRRDLDRLAEHDDRFLRLATGLVGPAPRIATRLEWVAGQDGVPFAYAAREPIDLFDVPVRFQRAVLLGDPGSGKSTCLRDLARRELSRSDPARMPVLANLSEWTDPSMSAVEFLRSRSAALADEFESLVADGRLLFLLDGLNELPVRRAAPGNARHEYGGSGTAMFRTRLSVIDPRERSLREFAASVGARCRFVLSCRAHGYRDSLQWAIVELVPARDEQVEEFIDACLPPDRAGALNAAVRSSARLRRVVTNPFFLQCAAGAYRPGASFDNRGEILTALLDSLLKEAGTAGSTVATRDEIIAGAGPLAFRRLAKGDVGAFTEVPAGQRAALAALATIGLVVVHGEGYHFRHQIVQEFLAAAALRAGAVRYSVGSLLTRRNHAEALALWADIDPDGRAWLAGALWARNLPWRRPRSPTSGPLRLVYQVSSTLFIAVALTFVFDAVAGPVHALTSPVGYLLDEQRQLVGLLVALLLTRAVWWSSQYHEPVIANAAYALTRGGSDYISATVAAFGRIRSDANRADVARSLATASGVVTDAVVAGVASRNWRVRAGCVATLGEIVRLDPDDQHATDALIALCGAVGDPHLAGRIVAGLVWCADARVPGALMQLIAHEGPTGLSEDHDVQAVLIAARRRRRLDDTMVGPDVTERLDQLMTGHPELVARSTAIRAMGWLAPPGAEDRLARLASDRNRDNVVREEAIATLGWLRTPAAVTALVQLDDDLVDDPEVLQTALENAGDVATVPALRVAATKPMVSVRVGTARALGKVGNDEAIALLAGLANDEMVEVRHAAATALGRTGRIQALPAMLRLARDDVPAVRRDAVLAILAGFPDAAAAELAPLAADTDYPNRREVMRLLRRDSTRIAADPVRTWLRLDQLRALLRQERLAMSTWHSALGQVLVRVLNDADLARRYQSVVIRAYVAWWAIVEVVVIAVGLALARVGLVVIAHLSTYWPMLVGWLVAGVVAIALHAAISRGWDVRVLGRVLVAIAYVVAMVIALIGLPVVVLGLLGYVWWCIALLALAGWLAYQYWMIRRRRRAPREIAAVLATATRSR